MSADWEKEVCGLDRSARAEGLAADGLASLRALADAIEACDDKDGRLAALTAWTEDTAQVAAAAEAQLRAPTAVEGLIARIAAHYGLGGAARGLHTSLKKEAKAAAKAARADALADRGEIPPSTVDLVAALGDGDVPGGLLCPGGWELDAAGIRRLSVDRETGEVIAVPVAPRPIVVTGRCREVGEGRTSLRLEWATRLGRRHQIVPRGKVADSRSFVELAGVDAPVHSNNARDLVQFIADWEDVNSDALPEARVTSAMGWQGDAGQDGFMWGRTQLLAGREDQPGLAIEELPPSRWEERQVHLLVDDGGRDLAGGFHAGGTWDAWLEVVAEARVYPAVMLALYAALVPPLMIFLPTLPNFIVDYCGPTSEGKTTTLRFAASAWGCPDERSGGLIRSWDATRVWIERTAALLGHLPLFLDDTKRARRPEEVARVLYDLANGIGRGRGSVSGTRDMGRWRTVLLTTGEAPATSFTNDGGTRARTLSLWGSPFGGGGVETGMAVRRITEGVLRNYGHAGPRLIRWLLDAPDASEQVDARYKAARDRWEAPTNGNAVAGRAAQYVAGLEVAQWVLHDVLGIPRPVADPLLHAWTAVCGASVQADRASDALRDVLSWATGHQARFFGRQPSSGYVESIPHAGWLGAWASDDGWDYVGVLPHELRRVLQGEGYDFEAVVRTWLDRGWLLRDGKHRGRKLKIGGAVERCYAITRAACDEVQGSDDE